MDEILRFAQDEIICRCGGIGRPACSRQARLTQCNRIQKFIFYFMYYVYVLLSLKNSHLYIGYTNNLKRRLLQHQNGKVNSTKPYLPYILVYSEKFDNQKKAILREKELKTSKGRKFLKQFIN